MLTYVHTYVWRKSYILFRILISSARKGRYKIPLSTMATSNPMSPVIFAIGPWNQVCNMHGTTSANDNAPAVIAATPLGKAAASFQMVASYEE